MTASGRIFLLVHGAFHGGWCWSRVRDWLSDRGHRVFCPTMSGMGERRHLLNPGIGIETWVSDITGLMEAEGLRDVVLAGHSFGGRMISGVAERMPERIRHLVYLDAALPLPGQSNASTSDAAAWRRLVESAVIEQGTPCIPAPSAMIFGLDNPGDIAWVDRQLTPMPVRLFEEPLNLTREIGNGIPATYVRCTAPAYRSLEWAHPKVRELGWRWLDLPTGHDAMVSAPEDVARILQDVAELDRWPYDPAGCGSK